MTERSPDTSGNPLKVLLPVALLLFAVPYFISHHHAKPRPGPLVREVPEITLIEGGTSWRYEQYTIKPLAHIKLRARVLHTERYYFDRPSDVSPIDLAVGWRGMSDSHYLDQLRISQGGRWYFFRSRTEEALPNDMISMQSKNVHVIPANQEIARRVKSVSVDQVFHAEGSLVRVTDPGGFEWTSSTRLGGTGDGSCLLFWVDQFDIEE